LDGSARFHILLIANREKNVCRCGVESWLGEFEQGDRWSFCLTAGRMAADQERVDDETSAYRESGVVAECHIEPLLAEGGTEFDRPFVPHRLNVLVGQMPQIGMDRLAGEDRTGSRSSGVK
jgi:hypothetical protein